MYEFTITKNDIMKEATARDAELRRAALKSIHGEISEELQKAYQEARETGKYTFSKKEFIIPEYFRNEDGSYSFPGEISASLKMVGVEARVSGNKYFLV